MLAFSTKKGSKYVNQDNGAVWTFKRNENESFHPQAPDVFYMGVVADGHGEEGEDCSSHIVKQVEQWSQHLITQPFTTYDDETWTKTLNELTESLHNSFQTFLAAKLDYGYPRTVDKDGVVRKSSGSAVHAGSTFSMFITFPLGEQFKTVTCQLGDSDIYFNQKQVPSFSLYRESTWQHLQTFPAEKRLTLFYNIRPVNKQVFTEEGKLDLTFITPSKDEKGNQSGYTWNYNKGLQPTTAKYEPSVYLYSHKNSVDYVAIACLQCIGDFYGHPCGLTHVPTVNVFTTATMPCVVAGSDGAWNTIDKDDKWISLKCTTSSVDLQMVRDRHSQLDLAVEEQVQFLYELYGEKFGSKHIDDISLAVLFP